MAIAVPNVLGYINKAKQTEAEAEVRNLYLACTAELAIILGNTDDASMGDTVFTSTDYDVLTDLIDHKDDVAQMAQLDSDLFDYAVEDLSMGYTPSDIEVGNYTVYIYKGIIAYVVHKYDRKTYAIYNGISGNVNLIVGSDDDISRDLVIGGLEVQ